MGQCLSAPLPEHDEPNLSPSRNDAGSALRSKPPVKIAASADECPSQNRSRLSDKLSIFLNPRFWHVDYSASGDDTSKSMSPAPSPSPSQRTAPETPCSSISMSPATPKGASPSAPLSSLITAFPKFGNSSDSPLTTRSEYYTQHSSLSPTSSFLLDGIEGIMIPEEVDPDAPSDEEDSYLRFAEKSQDPNHISKWEMEPGPIVMSHRFSPDRGRRRRGGAGGSSTSPMVAVKARNARRVAHPTSIVRHHPHISPPLHTPVTTPPQGPPSSVERQHLADFHKLQIQVQLQEKSLKQSKRLQKLEDRICDVQAYRKLCKNFEEIQDAVSVHSQQSQGLELDRTAAFDLQKTREWFVDFEMLDRTGDFSDLDDDDDDRSAASQFSQQSHLSLLSQSSMDSQRMFYAAKKHSRETTERIEKLELLLKSINDRKTGKKEKPTNVEPVVDDYGPRARRGSMSSRASVTSQTSHEPDYGPVTTRSALPSHVITRDDYGPAARRGSATSQLSMISFGGSSRHQGQRTHVNDDDEVTKSGPVGSNPPRIRSKHEARESPNPILVTIDFAATPKRSGNAPVEPTSEGPKSVEFKETATIDIIEEKRRDEVKKVSDHVPRWRQFPDQALVPQQTVKRDESGSCKKLEAPLRGSNIFAMTTEEFLQIADDQFDDVHHIISISKSESDDEEMFIAARRLDFAN